MIAWTRCISSSSRVVFISSVCSPSVIAVLETGLWAASVADTCTQLCVATGIWTYPGAQSSEAGDTDLAYITQLRERQALSLPPRFHPGNINSHSRFRIAFTFVYALYQSTSCCSQTSIKQSYVDNRRSEWIFQLIAQLLRPGRDHFITNRSERPECHRENTTILIESSAIVRPDKHNCLASFVC